MARPCFVDPETVTLPLFDDGQYWITVKRQLNAGEDKQIQIGALRRMAQTTDQHEDRGVAFDVDLEAFAFQKVLTYLVDWNLADRSGKTVSIETPKAKREAVKALHPAMFSEVERAIDAHAAGQQEKKVQTGPSGPQPSS